MPIAEAIEALKRKDFRAARAAIAREDVAVFTFQHFLIKGLAELAEEDWAPAQATFTLATERFPNDALLWLNRGIAEENNGEINMAVASQQRCLALNPEQGEAYGNLSNLYRKQGRFGEAEQMARHAAELGASKSDALNSLGLALGKQGKFAEADEAFRIAQCEAPANSAIVANRANLAIDQLHFDEAWPLFAAARAIEDKAVYRRDEGMARLLTEDYAHGWALCEARLDMPHALRLHPACPRWHGEGLKGKKLLILAEQGFGDAVQFCRYQKFLLDAELVWAVPKNLLRLLTGALRGTVMDETGPLPACDYYVPVLSLPLLTDRLQPEAAPIDLTTAATPRLPQGKHKTKIGLVWTGSCTHERDHERSLRLEQWAPLFYSVAADFYAPFIGEGLNEIGDLPITRLDHLITDFADTAALLKQMDYLVSVDTAAAHVAGALGVKTFLLLPYCPDWRWGVSGAATPWYASMTLLRQPTYGDWANVVKNLVTLLAYKPESK